MAAGGMLPKCDTGHAEPYSLHIGISGRRYILWRMRRSAVSSTKGHGQATWWSVLAWAPRRLRRRVAGAELACVCFSPGGIHAPLARRRGEVVLAIPVRPKPRDARLRTVRDVTVARACL